MSGCCFTPAVKDLVDQTFRSNVVHVHLRWRFHQCRKRHAKVVLLMPAVLDGIIHEGNQPGCDDNTKMVSDVDSLSFLEIVLTRQDRFGRRGSFRH